MGEVSKILESPRGYYFIRVIDRTDFDKVKFAEERDIIEDQLLSQKKDKMFNQWYNQLKEEADIEDNRNFYRN